jgi:TRAP-type C4-dicarboxylate transport system permease small subunit
MINAVNKLMRLIELFLIVLLAISVVIISMQIFWRYVLVFPLGWTEQVARSAFIWLVMLGIPVMFNRNITMSFDIFLNNIRGEKYYIIQGILKLLGIGFCIFYFFASLQLCIRTGNRTVPGIGIPLNALYSAQPVCAFLLFIVFIKQIVEIIPKIKNKEGIEKE